MPFKGWQYNIYASVIYNWRTNGQVVYAQKSDDKEMKENVQTLSLYITVVEKAAVKHCELIFLGGFVKDYTSENWANRENKLQIITEIERTST